MFLINTKGKKEATVKMKNPYSDYPLFVKSLVYLSGTLSPLSSGAMTGIASAKRYLVCIKEGS